MDLLCYCKVVVGLRGAYRGLILCRLERGGSILVGCGCEVGRCAVACGHGEGGEAYDGEACGDEMEREVYDDV